MNKYELTIVVDGKITPAKRKSFQATFEKILGALEGKIIETKEWGEKPLAYPIKKITTGYFLHYILELETQSVKAIELKLKMEEEVLRHLFVRI